MLSHKAASSNDASSGADAAAAAELATGCFAPFVATPPEQITRLVALASILKNDIVCDLGFGDGALLCGMAQSTGCKVCGCEIDANLVLRAQGLVASLRMGANVKLTESGIARYMLSPDFLQATVIFCFLVPSQLEAIRPALETAMSLGTRVVTQRYEIPGLEHVRCVDHGQELQHVASAALDGIADDADECQRYFPNAGPAFLYACAGLPARASA